MVLTLIKAKLLLFSLKLFNRDPFIRCMLNCSSLLLAGHIGPYRTFSEGLVDHSNVENMCGSCGMLVKRVSNLANWAWVDSL